MSGELDKAVEALRTRRAVVELQEARREVQQEERAFHRRAGARDVLFALYEMGGLSIGVREKVVAWIREGGSHPIVYRGVQLFPPEPTRAPDAKKRGRPKG